MRAWILGSSGMVGTCLHHLIEKQGFLVFSSTHDQLDVTNYDSLRALAYKIQPTHIFNCTAFTAVDEAEKNRQEAWDVNAKAPGLIGKVAVELGCKVIHISTDYVFSGTKSIPFKEDDLKNPVNFYGMSKLEGEKNLLDQMPFACIVRTSWVYGSTGKNFISSLVALMKSNQSILVANDQVSKPTFCYDLAHALLDLKDATGIFHFASGEEASRYEIAKEVFKYMKEHSMPIACQQVDPTTASTFPTPAQRPNYSSLDTSKYEKYTHKKPRSWKETIKELFNEG